MVELRHLRYFIAVAEELNFSRAAERMHMAQPPLSAAIRQLERDLGVDLCVRTTRECEVVNGQGMRVLESELKLPLVPFSRYSSLLSRAPDRRQRVDPPISPP